MTSISVRFREILQQVIEKTKADGISWHRVEKREDSFSSRETFAVGFPNGSVLSVTYDSPSSEADSVLAELRNTNNERIASLYAEDAFDADDFAFLMNLYEQAHRSATHWDKEFDEVEKALSSESRVGTDPRQGGFSF